MMHKSQLCDIAEEIYCRSSLWNEFNILYKKAKVQNFMFMKHLSQQGGTADELNFNGE